MRQPDERPEGADGTVELELDNPPDSPQDASEPGDSPDEGITATDANDDFVSAFVFALREASEEELDSIRRLIDGNASRSEQVRLQHIHSRMDELTVYTDLFEEFLDEYGAPTGYASELEADLETIRSELGTVRRDVESLEADLTEVRTDQSLLRSQVTELESSLETLRTDIDEIESDAESTHERHDTEIADLTAQFDELATQLESAETTLETKTNTLSDVIEEFESVRTELADVFDRDGIESVRDDRHETDDE